MEETEECGCLQGDRDFGGRVISVLSLGLSFDSATTPPSSSLGTMEALSVDMGRLKSGEVNLGVRSPDITTRMEGLI